MIRDAVLTPGKERPEVMVCDRHRPLAYRLTVVKPVRVAADNRLSGWGII